MTETNWSGVAQTGCALTAHPVILARSWVPGPMHRDPGPVQVRPHLDPGALPNLEVLARSGPGAMAEFARCAFTAPAAAMPDMFTALTTALRCRGGCSPGWGRLAP